MARNDLTPLIEVCKKCVKGFSEYEYPKGVFGWTTCPYEIHAIMVRHEYWEQYLQKAIAIALESPDMETFDKKIVAFGVALPDEWLDDIVI